MTGQPRVLLVDDEPYWLETLSDLLRRWQFRVTAANTPSEALEAFSDQEFEAVITDFEMPEMNGAQLIKSMKQTGRKVPMILMSCDDVMGEAAAERDPGIDAYVNKCGDPGEIRRCLEGLVSQCHA
jgi:CheY-like chemotaxis protein